MTEWRLFQLAKQFLSLGIILAATGCATMQNEPGHDPLEPANRVFFNVNESLDRALLKPAAKGYVRVTPVPVRTGITNFFNNLSYLNVILNDFLQGKFEQGVNDSLRFIFNSTLGIGGWFDVAGDDMGLPAHEEDFGQTLAVWGVDKGFYLYLPLFGPNTLRDTADFIPSTFLNPFFYVSGPVLFPLNAVNAINTRANLLEASNIRDQAALDPYAFTREAYLQQREFLIHDGNPPLSGYEDIFEEE